MTKAAVAAVVLGRVDGAAEPFGNGVEVGQDFIPEVAAWTALRSAVCTTCEIEMPWPRTYSARSSGR
jgi:hypothetical protein